MKPDPEFAIVPFEAKYAKAFADLNYAWIMEYFKVEDHDRELLDHPSENIIEKGGEIFFAVRGNEVAGTVALIEAGGDAFELAKMAVSKQYRRRGIADRLVEICVDHARQCGKKRIYLLSNTSLGPAIDLYIKHGFKEAASSEPGPYERVNIHMELAIVGPAR
ncbi:MAG TPA: GNAT family N-acetyltransferase [Pyrinomonadaceae bacterium]|nr:GNAT family N-acetyltransferase [Pyrinomonadaceae bacterium]